METLNNFCFSINLIQRSEIELICRLVFYLVIYSFTQYIYIYIYIIWKSDLTDKMKRSFFQAAVVSILLYGCTTWTLTKRLKKKLDGNYTRMLRAILNQVLATTPHETPTIWPIASPSRKLYKLEEPDTQDTAGEARTKLISDLLLWTPAYGQAKAERPARTYIQQLCEDTGWNPENLPKATNDREKWRERVRDIRVGGTTWWWWWGGYMVWFGLVVWVLWHINLCRLFNAKSIFIQIITSISNNSVKHKHAV